MNGDLPSYEVCKAALAVLAPTVLGVVPHISGAGIQGDDPATYRVVVYVDKGAKEALLTGGKIPPAISIGSGPTAIAVPIVIEEQDAPTL